MENDTASLSSLLCPNHSPNHGGIRGDKVERRSIQCGLPRSMRLIFQPRFHSLICFSRRIAFLPSDGLRTKRAHSVRDKPRHRSPFIVLTLPTDVSQRKGLNSSEKIVWDLRFVNPLINEHAERRAQRGLNPRAAGPCRPPWEGTAGLSRRLINKTGYRGHARARDRGEVGALGDHRASLRGQLPAEADAVVMPIDRPAAAETAAGATLLDGPHHGIDRSVPFAGH